MLTALDRYLFVTGIFATALGQFILNLLSFPTLSRPLFYEAPIDYGHWLLLIGALLMIPFAARIPRRGWRVIVGPVLIVGIVCVIGMTVLDLVSWSLSGTSMRESLHEHLSAEPSIWVPFIIAGPTYIFGTGLVLPSLAYLKTAMLGVSLVVGSAVLFLTLLAGTSSWYFVIGYAGIAVGYLLCFRHEATSYQP